METHLTVPPFGLPDTSENRNAHLVYVSCIFYIVCKCRDILSGHIRIYGDLVTVSFSRLLGVAKIRTKPDSKTLLTPYRILHSRRFDLIKPVITQNFAKIFWYKTTVLKQLWIKSLIFFSTSPMSKAFLRNFKWKMFFQAWASTANPRVSTRCSSQPTGWALRISHIT